MEESSSSGYLGLAGEDGLEQLADIIHKEAATRELAEDFIEP